MSTTAGASADVSTAPNTCTVINPASDTVLAEVPCCTPQELDAAIDEARQALPRWRVDIDARRSMLRRCAEVLRIPRNALELATLVTQEQGKPKREALAEVQAAAHWFSSLPFWDVEEAIRRANGTRFGLGGSVWTQDEKLAWEVAAQLECGTAWINQHAALDPLLPFGGHKQSGIGCENGWQGVAEFTRTKVIYGEVHKELPYHKGHQDHEENGQGG